MSHLIARILMCDDCPARFICTPGVGIAESRAEAARAGWHANRDANRDFCPKCMDRRMNAAIRARREKVEADSATRVETRRKAVSP